MIETASVKSLQPSGTILESYQTREEWLDARRGARVGASDAAVILGLSKWKSPLALYYEKTGANVLADDDARAQERREWGLLLEEPIAQRYASITNRFVGNPAPFSMLVSKKYRWATASIDRWVCGLNTNATPPPNGLPALAPLQIKMASAWVADEWSVDESGAVNVPLTYQIQVQHEMMVTGARWASIAALIGGNELRWADLVRDDRLIDVIAEKEAEFAQRIELQEPPPADGHEASRAILKALNPKDDGTTITLPPDALAWHRQWEQAKTGIDELEKQAAVFKNLLIQAIGPHTFADLGEGVRYSYKTQSRKEYTVKATEFRVLRQAK